MGDPYVIGQGPRPEPMEDDLVYCKRRFGGKTFECRMPGCTEVIYWPGVCDRCARMLRSGQVKVPRHPKRRPAP